MGSDEPIFRDGAIESAASPDQLNAIAPLVTPRHMLLMGSVFLLAGILMGWAFFGRVPLTVTGTALVLPDGSGCVAFFPLAEGKKLDPDMPVSVAVVTLDESKHGTIAGTIAALDTRPIPLDSITSATGDEILARQITEQLGASLRATVVFERDARGALVWKGGRGSIKAPKEFTPCEVRVDVGSVRPVELALPWLFADRPE